MTTSSAGPHFQLAQVNVARKRAPLTDPQMAGFVAMLQPINALADASPGFVWRLIDEEEIARGNAASLQAFGDETLVINLSVWESPEALRQFVFHSAHQPVMKDRRQWFERFERAYTALWWVPAGHRPNLAEARERLEYLRTHGETARAFSFRKLFPPPDSA